MKIVPSSGMVISFQIKVYKKQDYWSFMLTDLLGAWLFLMVVNLV